MAVKIRIYVVQNNALPSVLYGCEDQDIRGTKQCFCPLFCMAMKISIYVVQSNVFVLCFVWL